MSATRRGSRFVVVLAMALLVACGGATGPETVRRPTGVPTTAVSPTPASICHAHGPYPDPRCTPGATNPNVTEGTIATTICVRGWTGTVRPPLAMTAPIKTERMKAYGIPATRRTNVELDHFIPLELGGATGEHPGDLANLWPEESQPPPGYHEKDVVENYLNDAVCHHDMTLGAAQQAMTTDWVKIYRQMATATPTP